MGEEYFIWSNEHRCWWGPKRCGYTMQIQAAGRYTRAEALTICRDAHDGWSPGEAPPEIPVSVDDAMQCCLSTPPAPEVER